MTSRWSPSYVLILGMRRIQLRLLFRFLNISILLWAISAAGLARQTAPAAPSAPAVSADFAEARKLMQQGKFDEALKELQSLEARDPGAKGLALEMGAAYYKKSDFPKAIKYLKEATAADPANGEAIQLLGLSYYLGGHPADAIPLLEKVQGWYSRANVDASYILGISYIQTKNYDQARKAFGKMFDVAPDSAASYLFAARMLFRQEFDTVRWRSIRNCPGRTICWASCMCINRGFRKRFQNSRRSWRLIRRMLRRTTSWPTRIPGCRNMSRPNSCCSARFGWMHRQPGRSS
ncbi:MAG: hypothetical protein DMG79_04500 [Acidobacteria bacterium]|nr:MAG: hypothetical protein DMG79_04500 [Acidobacteriota bacterium]